MFKAKKLFESEWYFRKYISVITIFVKENKIDEIKLIHNIKWVYKSTFGRHLHLIRPKNLNEKLIWLSLYWRNPLKSLCADKVKVRDYVTNKGLSSILVPIIGIYSNPDNIPYDALPEQFVLKCNHGCGYNIIVTEKKRLDTKSATLKIKGWLSDNYRGGLAEIHYSTIAPRLIICEEYLPSLGDGSIIDYKLHCFNGTPDFVLVCYERSCDGEAKLATFDFEWNQLHYVIDEDKVCIPMPDSLSQMVEYAKVLSKPFPFVRVDFYDIDGKPLLGELTFTPYGNMINYFKDEVLNNLGRKLSLPQKYKG